MIGRFWADYQSAGYIEIDGVRHCLKHLDDFSYVVQLEDAQGNEVAVNVAVRFSSHCVSKGPPKGERISFKKNFDSLIIDGNKIWRRFLPARYEASKVLPSIIRTLNERPCLFTSQQNFLTIEMKQLIPGYPEGTQYEVYFNVKQRGRLSVDVYVESAYVRDQDADNDPYKFKKDDRISGKRLLLNRGLGKPVRRPPRP